MAEREITPLFAGFSDDPVAEEGEESATVDQTPVVDQTAQTATPHSDPVPAGEDPYEVWEAAQRQRHDEIGARIDQAARERAALQKERVAPKGQGM